MGLGTSYTTVCDSALTLKAPATAADRIHIFFLIFQSKVRFYIFYEMSARQTMHMIIHISSCIFLKNDDNTNNKKKIGCCLLQLCLALKGLILVLLNPDIPCLCKQFRSRSFGFFRSALLVIQYVNFCPQSGLSNLIGWKLEVGMAS